MPGPKEPLVFVVEDTDQGKRLDAFVASVSEMSRSAAERLIGEGCVTVNGRTETKKYSVKMGEQVSLFLPCAKETDIVAENIPLDVVYEDEDLLVINKPQGMVVHPAPGNESGTLVNALLYHCGSSLSGIGGEIRPGIVHRIDKDTSGLLVVAKNDYAHAGLSAQLSGHHIRRVYFALAQGGFREDKGQINLPIGRHPVDRKKMAVLTDTSHGAREAVTDYTVLERFGAITFLKLQLHTGRIHQIRVHLSHLGHSILGDPLYHPTLLPFEKKHHALLHGQCLHAGELTFTHPKTGEEMHFSCPLPKDFEALLTILRSESEK